ncbi:hypothetical protein EVAR_33061_1 [Eumeta japonica]|uniref:Uncharacterized protein n=1 Tax=Eumeta variegata TaxID=151549 RepID=A0A4C1WVD8_EUMVA|nr:hypothetical protein EVAR_33061_1 [Eumeta japonica]
MRPFRNICGVTWEGRHKNNDVRKRCGLKEHVVARVNKNMLQWYRWGCAARGVRPRAAGSRRSSCRRLQPIRFQPDAHSQHKRPDSPEYRGIEADERLGGGHNESMHRAGRASRTNCRVGGGVAALSSAALGARVSDCARPRRGAPCLFTRGGARGAAGGTPPRQTHTIVFSRLRR